MGKYTYEEKLEMYNKGQYRFGAPSVCTHYWNIEDWIKWIDAGNRWLPEGKDKNK